MFRKLMLAVLVSAALSTLAVGTAQAKLAPGDCPAGDAGHYETKVCQPNHTLTKETVSLKGGKETRWVETRSIQTKIGRSDSVGSQDPACGKNQGLLGIFGLGRGGANCSEVCIENLDQKKFTSVVFYLGGFGGKTCRGSCFADYGKIEKTGYACAKFKNWSGTNSRSGQIIAKHVYPEDYVPPANK